MNFRSGENNSRLIGRLEQSVKDGKVSHAYIFEGPSNMDKTDFARSFIKGVLCPRGCGENCGMCSGCDKIDHGNHEDITYLEKDGLSVKDAAVETIQEKLSVKPLGDRNVVIISDCDTMTARAQNRLLKTLEEPPGNSMLILLSENMENLAQTILSRCVKFRLEGGQEETGDAKAEKIVKMSLEGSPFFELNREISEYGKDRDAAQQLLDSMEQEYRKMMEPGQKGLQLYKFEDIYDNIRNVEAARKKIRQGMSAGYALKDLILRISG